MPDKVTSDKVFTELREMLGHRLSDDIIERLICSQDMAPIPKQLLAILRIRNVPDYVVRPTSTDEVAEVVRFAADQHVPITARAGATSALFNAVPTRQGIVLDVKSLRGIVQLDEDDLSVTVRAGTTFAELEDELAQHDLALKCYPSSAPSATIGGWLCTGGQGIGSLQHGPFVDQVQAAELVSQTGGTEWIGNGPDSLLASITESDGTLGLVTQLRLTLRRAPESTRHQPLSAPDLASAARFLRHAGTTGAYFVSFHDEGFYRLCRASEQLGSAVVRAEGVENERTTILVTLQDDPSTVSEALRKVMNLALSKGLHRRGEEDGTQEWDDRFRSLRIKRSHPGMIGAEVWLPVAQLRAYITKGREMASAIGLDVGNYGYLVRPGWLLTFSMLPLDQSQMSKLLFVLPIVGLLNDLAIRLGGRPYGLGLWNAPYVYRMLDSHQIRTRRTLKSKLDPWHVINPGKGLDAPRILGLAYPVGTHILQLLSKALLPAEDRRGGAARSRSGKGAAHSSLNR